MKEKTFIFYRLLAFLLSIIYLSSCSTAALIPRKTQKNLHQQITKSAIFSKGFTGFQLYDPVAKKVLYEQFADKYFTPASNTKIFTFYTASKILGDSIPALKYQVQGDSLFFWGTGDPSLLHPHLPDSQKVIQFLKTRKEQLFYCSDNFMDNRYGSGWMWDDYPYYFQVEKSALPIFGNFIRVQGTNNSYSFKISPSYFTQKVEGNPDLGGSTARFYRKENSNVIEYNQKPVGSKDIDRVLPFMYSDSLIVKLLESAIDKPVNLIGGLDIGIPNSQTIYGIETDTVLEKMMVESDNFLAEQLILLCANEIFDTLNTQRGIKMAIDSLFQDSPDDLLWYDGSGLTRYNQFTPRSIVHVLSKIYHEMPQEKWAIFFQDGNQFGKSVFTDKRFTPFVFGKSGSMRNVRCLSGFLMTRSGRTLIFSFMNNHIPGSSRPWTAEMEQVLIYLHQTL